MRMHRPSKAVLVLLAIFGFFMLDSCSEAGNDAQSLSRVDVYFVDSWHMTTTLPLDCQRLHSGEFPAQSISITDSSELAHWSHSLDSLKLDPWRGEFQGDCRICCMVYDMRGQVAYSIALWPTGLKINDSVYQFDGTLLSLVRPHLPVDYLPDSYESGPFHDTLEP